MRRSGKATDLTGATMPTVLAHRAPPLRSSCRPQVFQLLTLFPACRDGDESPSGRPGGWEDCRSRHHRDASGVRSTGKAAQGEIGMRKLRKGTIGSHTNRAVCCPTTRLSSAGDTIRVARLRCSQSMVGLFLGMRYPCDVSQGEGSGAAPALEGRVVLRRKATEDQ